MANPLIAWMKAREELRCRKENGMKQPWTFDPILAQYRFTNIRRRDDRVSRWIIKHIIPLQDHPEFLEFLALCRWVNWPPTINELLIRQATIGPMKWDQFAKIIDLKTARGEKAWTGAYMVRADKAGRSKAEYVVFDVCLGGISSGVKQDILASCELIHEREDVWEEVRAQKYWGSFMAGQFVDDLTWTKYLSKPKDDYTWAPQGPGSLRGFNRLLGMPLEATCRDTTYWCDHLMEWRREAIAALGPQYNDLTLMDIQNCLCEFDKYERVRLGEGRPRSTYRPETAYKV